ncbi:unnamed protein product [Parascedosporium putredinis]|uniref:Uncharacterized protein n=1 Tax=Parascedosporium putredinis TaxID=1442378 RepID=A0A9P1GYR9_9PEZI|nr:unnamed protein product [Parascedosporium putredinis]CAI7990892.1 unnamed protein product [Parascedosporium putredinis]
MQHSYSSSYQQGSPSHASSESEDGPPPVLARFFYPSSCSIDDSFSPGTSAAASSEPRYVKAQYQPFSWTDNHRLERAWRTLVDPIHQSAHSLAQNCVSGPSLAQDFADILSHITKYIAATHDAKHGPNLQLSHMIPDGILAGGPAVSALVCCPELYFDVENEMREAFCPRFRSTQGELSIDSVVRKVVATLKGLRGGPNLMAGPHHTDSKPRCNMPDDEANPAPGGYNPRMARAGIDANLMEPRAGPKEVVVGASRLHTVSLPALEMRPIYWSPVNDRAVVLRATWFYKDTMQPIPVEVANRLESTYRELQPWTETWADELRCAVNVGPLGEEKVSCPLWPQLPSMSQEPGLEDPPSITDPSCAARCFNSELSAEGRLNKLGDEMNKQVATPATPPFANYHIIFKGSRLAFLLKPSLKPSAYYGRRPVAKIMRGSTVGIPVIRGFGQKFAERVESFHFTHAINAFRRAVNLELESPAVKTALREEGTGIMVLPINWRQDLSFEDGGPMTEADRMARAQEAFGLKDIEPATIPAADADRADAMAKDITGEAGTLGCLAIDNVYNILAKEDPIAYLLNGTIDPSYAANLSVAYAPSTAASFVQTVGNAMRKYLPFDGPKKKHHLIPKRNRLFIDYHHSLNWRFMIFLEKTLRNGKPTSLTTMGRSTTISILAVGLWRSNISICWERIVRTGFTRTLFA